MAAVGKVEMLHKHAAVNVGEGPHWEESSGKLLYVDINAQTVNRFHVETKVEEQVACDSSLIVPCEGGGYIVSSQRKLGHFDWDTQVVTDLAEAPPIGTNDRFNDGKCDRQGRLWAGTVGAKLEAGKFEEDKGRLYTLTKGNLSVADATPVTLSNGLAWTADDSIMYFIDSIPRHVYAYDFDSVNGTVSNRRVAVDISQWSIEDVGLPDGMCIDQDGKLWIAGFFSSKVQQFDPVTGKKLAEIQIPAKKVTSCCFGGKDYSELFVTTAAIGYTPEEKEKVDPLAGSIFKVTELGTKGFAAPIYQP